MAKSNPSNSEQILESNRKARFDYEILDEMEAGIVLWGSEVKAIRERRISLKESYCAFVKDELFLMQAHISDYAQAHARNHPAIRARKLLLHRRELNRWSEAVREAGMTIVALSLYVKDRHIKVKLGLARGKKNYDKRQVLKEREERRDMDRAIKERK
jgi:SsrA-binding protein